MSIGKLSMVTRQWVEEKIYNALGRLLLRSALTYVSTNDQSREENGVIKGPLTDRYSGWKSSDPNVKESETDGLRMELPGVAVVPIKGEPCLVLGAGPNRLIFPLSSARYRPKNLKHGEAILYNLAAAAKQATAKIDQDGNVTVKAPAGKSVTVQSEDGNATVKLDGAGKITIDSKAAQDVVVNGGTLRVARVTDPVIISGDRVTPATFAFWCEQVRLQIIAAGGGNVGDPPAPIGTIDGTTGGALRFKG